MAPGPIRRWRRLHSEDGFYRQLLILCLLLSVATCLPAPATRLSRLGFLLLTLLLAVGLGPSLPSALRRRSQPLRTQLYRALAAFTVLFQLVWLFHPSSIHYSAPLLLASFGLFVVWSLARLVTSLSLEPRVDKRLLSGATAGYLLLGLGGGLMFSVLETLQPGGFRDNLSGQQLDLPAIGAPSFVTWDLDFSRLVYFGFVCLTTVGFGDITPVTPAARLLSMALSVMGPLYIAVVLGLLISRFSSGVPSPVEPVQPPAAVDPDRGSRVP